MILSSLILSLDNSPLLSFLFLSLWLTFLSLFQWHEQEKGSDEDGEEEDDDS